MRRWSDQVNQYSRTSNLHMKLTHLKTIHGHNQMCKRRNRAAVTIMLFHLNSRFAPQKTFMSCDYSPLAQLQWIIAANAINVRHSITILQMSNYLSYSSVIVFLNGWHVEFQSKIAAAVWAPYWNVKIAHQYTATKEIFSKNFQCVVIYFRLLCADVLSGINFSKKSCSSLNNAVHQWNRINWTKYFTTSVACIYFLHNVTCILFFCFLNYILLLFVAGKIFKV